MFSFAFLLLLLLARLLLPNLFPPFRRRRHVCVGWDPLFHPVPTHTHRSATCIIGDMPSLVSIQTSRGAKESVLGMGRELVIKRGTTNAAIYRIYALTSISDNSVRERIGGGITYRIPHMAIRTTMEQQLGVVQGPGESLLTSVAGDIFVSRSLYNIYIHVAV